MSAWFIPTSSEDTENPEDRHKVIARQAQQQPPPPAPPALGDRTNAHPAALPDPQVVMPVVADPVLSIPFSLRQMRERDAHPPDDIDEDDKDDPVFCAEQAQDIYDNMRMEEVVTKVNPDYFKSVQTDITPKMRMIIVDWLAQIAARTKMAQETMFLTVWIIDKYLSTHAISRDQFQLVGITAIFIANKMEEVNATDIRDLAGCCDITNCEQEMIKLEPEMLQAIDWKLLAPTPLLFLRRYSKASNADATRHTVSKFIIELSLGYSESLAFLPSVQAAASVYLARFFLDDDVRWPHEVEYYSNYSEADILPCARMMFGFIKNPDKKFKFIVRKYASAGYGEIARTIFTIASQKEL